MKTLILFVAAVLFGGCVEKIDIEKEKELLLKTDFEFAQKSKELGAAEAFYLYMDQNGIQFPASSDPITGNSAIRDAMKPDNDYQLNWEPQFAEVAKSGDMGWTWGKYTITTNGGLKTRNGKYLNVWVKQKDGNWKVRADIGNVQPDN